LATYDSCLPSPRPHPLSARRLWNVFFPSRHSPPAEQSTPLQPPRVAAPQPDTASPRLPSPRQHPLSARRWWDVFIPSRHGPPAEQPTPLQPRLRRSVFPRLAGPRPDTVSPCLPSSRPRPLSARRLWDVFIPSRHGPPAEQPIPLQPRLATVSPRRSRKVSSALATFRPAAYINKFLVVLDGASSCCVARPESECRGRKREHRCSCCPVILSGSSAVFCNASAANAAGATASSVTTCTRRI
jgi:hypothetical protein